MVLRRSDRGLSDRFRLKSGPIGVRRTEQHDHPISADLLAGIEDALLILQVQ